mmetsp:Transcript_10709/g.15622  ORF Transcript_10709/g.15622 Transcript_10709/m.15622 type:complete len:203 (+) Transcript_10709:720-1328(+)
MDAPLKSILQDHPKIVTITVVIVVEIVATTIICVVAIAMEVEIVVAIAVEVEIAVAIAVGVEIAVAELKLTDRSSVVVLAETITEAEEEVEIIIVIIKMHLGSVRRSSWHHDLDRSRVEMEKRNLLPMAVNGAEPIVFRQMEDVAVEEEIGGIEDKIIIATVDRDGIIMEGGEAKRTEGVVDNRRGVKLVEKRLVHPQKQHL